MRQKLLDWKTGDPIDPRLLAWLKSEWAKERNIPPTVLQFVSNGGDPEKLSSDPVADIEPDR
jgi:hypothetical protein